MTKVLTGMSGGVDSAAAALLLQRSGFEVAGVTLRTWTGADGSESRCCEIDDARSICRKLKIPYYALNCLREFRNYVIEPFVRDYQEGITPNPCILCNRYVKWEKLLYAAKVMGAEYIATGHYASVVKKPGGRYTVQKAVYAEKDQTYMLYRLSQEQLAATLMPLGTYSKSQVRAIAGEAGLSVASKPDSQELCFVPEGSYADYIAEHAGESLRGEGYFVDSEGQILGKHKGIIYYTVGQRKGLGLSLGYPAYIKSINAKTNEILIVTEDDLFSRELVLGDLNFLSISGLREGEKLYCRAKIRYHHTAQDARVEMTGSGRARVLFDKPVRAAAPGQSAVFYDEEDCVIGGGVILA